MLINTYLRAITTNSPLHPPMLDSQRIQQQQKKHNSDIMTSRKNYPEPHEF